MPDVNPHEDRDLLVCELQHRVESLLAENDKAREEVFALTKALQVMADRIEELEDAR